MYCPFIYGKFICDETLIEKSKQPEIRTPCYEDKCPIRIWEPKKKIGAIEIAGRCGVIINICEECEDLHKCKKSGESKEFCRQKRIDGMFRIAHSSIETVSPPEPVQKPRKPAIEVIGDPMP